MVKFVVLALALSFTLGTPEAAAQAWKGRGRVHGVVQDHAGKPIVGARIALAYSEGGEGPTATSDKAGLWKLSGLRGGGWDVDIAADGYMTRKLSVQISEFGAGPNIEAKLESVPEAAPVATPEDDHTAELQALLKTGDEHFKAGRFAEARSEYEKVLTERPEIVEVRRSIAYCYYREGNLAASIAGLETLIAATPTPSDIVLLANMLLEKGELDKALEWLGKVDETKLTDAGTFLNIGVLLFNKQKADDATRYFDKALARDPANGSVYYNRGLAHLQSGRNVQAKADFSRFLELSPNDGNAGSAREIIKSLGD